MKQSKYLLFLLICTMLFLCSCNTNDSVTSDYEESLATQIHNIENQVAKTYTIPVANSADMRLDATTAKDLYVRSLCEGETYYQIDENGTLWGKGANDHGQLGIGCISEEPYQDFQKIADHVIHLDCSQHEFTIFLTSDGCLYGMGNDYSGALLENPNFCDKQEVCVTSPKLLMDHVQYANCGRDDIVALKDDSTLWTWGVIYDFYETGYYQQLPSQIMDNVNITTGGFFNHTALKKDGTLWTWGYNYAWNCGTDNALFYKDPKKVAENVQMAWTGLLTYSTPDLTDQNIYPRQHENTIIKLTTGELLGCGVDIGETSRAIPEYYGSSDYQVTCSSTFEPVTIKDVDFNYFDEIMEE